MPYVVTLLELRTRAQLRADMEVGNFVKTTEWNGYIQASWNRLWRKFVKSGLSYVGEKTQTIVTVGTDTYPVPDDHAITLGFDWQIDTERWVELEEVMLKERNNYLLNGSNARGYRLAGSNLILYPKPPTGQTYRHLYVSRPSVLALDTDFIDGVAGFEEWIVWDVAMRALLKEESDVTVHKTERDALWAELDEDVEMRMLAKNRRVVQTAARSMGDCEEDMDPADYRQWR